MKLTPKIKKFQEGGEMAPEEMAPAEGAPMEEAPAEGGGGGDPLMQIAEMAMQALQANDGQLALQVCQAFVELIQQAQGGGGAPAGAQPAFKKGGKFSRWIKN